MSIRFLITFIFLATFSACKRDCRVVKSSFKDGKAEVIHFYPKCDDTTYYKGQVLYNTGQLASEGYFKNGQKIGQFKSWYANGQLESHWNMLNGKEEGLIQCWYPNGKKKKEGTLSNGIENGVQRVWDEHGKQLSEGTYVNGKRQGIWKFWLANGEYRERNYFNDILSGPTIERLDDNRQVIGQYSNGKENGLWIWKDSLGNLEQTAYYRDGNFDSIAIAYYSNGNIRERRVYKNGKLLTTKKD